MAALLAAASASRAAPGLDEDTILEPAERRALAQARTVHLAVETAYEHVPADYARPPAPEEAVAALLNAAGLRVTAGASEADQRGALRLTVRLASEFHELYVGPERPKVARARLRGTLELTDGRVTHRKPFGGRAVSADEPGVEDPKRDLLAEAFWRSDCLPALGRLLHEVWGVEETRPLLALLESPDAARRARAVQLLGRARDPRILDPVTAALGDASPEVRARAAEALGEIRELAALQVLRAAAKDVDADVRAAAERALERLGDGRAPRPAAQEPVGESAAARCEPEAAPPAETKQVRTFAEWAAALSEGPVETRRQAARALARSGDVRAIEPLLAALEDAEDDVRQAAAEALAAFDDPRVEQALAAALGDPYAHVRANAAAGLRSAAPVLTALDDADWRVRAYAARRLGELKARQAAAPLARRLADGERFVRAWAAEALGRIGDRRAAGPLAAALRDDAAEVRAAAAQALGELGDARTVWPLVIALKDDAGEVQAAAAEALGALRAREAVASLVSLLGYGEAPARRAAAWALGEIRGARAAEALRRAAEHDPEQAVRDAAREALARITPAGT